jgi:hypothetical protein
MAEKFGKMKCKTSFNTLFTLQVSKTQYSTTHGDRTPYSTMTTRHIKRNSIVQIEIFIAYKTKLF